MGMEIPALSFADAPWLSPDILATFKTNPPVRVEIQCTQSQRITSRLGSSLGHQKSAELSAIKNNIICGRLRFNLFSLFSWLFVFAFIVFSFKSSHKSIYLDDLDFLKANSIYLEAHFQPELDKQIMYT